MKRIFPRLTLPKVTIKAEWEGAMPGAIASCFDAGGPANLYLWKQFGESMRLTALEAQRIFTKQVREGELGKVPYIAGRKFPRWKIVPGQCPPGNIHYEWQVPPLSETMKWSDWNEEGETARDFIPPHKLLVAEQGLLAKSKEQKIRDEYVQWLKKERVLPKDFKFKHVERELEVFFSAIRSIYTFTRLATPEKLYHRKARGSERPDPQGEVSIGVTFWKPVFAPNVKLGEKERKALIKRWGREPFPRDPGKSQKLRKILSLAGASPEQAPTLVPIFEAVGTPKLFFERRIFKETGEGGQEKSKEYFFLPTHFISRACAAYLSVDRCTMLVSKALKKAIDSKRGEKGTWI